MKETMRIIFSGVAPHCNTGYGTQGRFLIQTLQELGHAVAIFAHHGVSDGAVNIGGLEYLPLFRDGWGHDVIGRHVKEWRADAVLSFHDVWTLRPEWPQSFDVPWITYSPIDSVPVPPVLVRVLREASHVVAMSRFGQAEMEKRGIPSTYIPHGIDTEIYCPGDKLEARRILGIPSDKFICLIAAANYYYPSRKAFPEQMTAFAAFHKEFPDTELLFHTAMTPTSGAGGLDINTLITSLGLTDCTANTPEYNLCVGVPDAEMALIYRAADVLLGASYAEGFGLCQAEAQACGTPIIVHNFAASPEFLYGGLSVPSAQQFWRLEGCWQAIPSIEAITAALREVYLNREDYAFFGLQAAEMVRMELDQRFVKNAYWGPFLDSIAPAQRLAEAAD